MRSAPEPHLHSLDLLRFVAALGVVLVHWCYSPGHVILKIDAAKFGYWGVHLFFLVSGFVILMSAQAQDFRGFIVARIVRLYPAFWVCCTISALACFQDPFVDWGRYLANMTMFPPPLVPYLNEAYWTLAVEAKFYLLIAILLLCGQLKRIEWVLWAWLAAALFAGSYPITRTFETQYAPFFAGGCACFLIRQRPTSARYALLLTSLILGLRAVVQEAAFKGGGLEPVPSAVLVGGFFVLIFAVARDWIVLPPSTLLVTLGAISYPLYLLHQRIAIEFAWTTDSYGLLGAALLWIVALSYVVHRWAERPLQRWLRQRLSGPVTHERPGHASLDTARAA